MVYDVFYHLLNSFTRFATCFENFTPSSHSRKSKKNQKGSIALTLFVHFYPCILSHLFAHLAFHINLRKMSQLKQFRKILGFTFVSAKKHNVFSLALYLISSNPFLHLSTNPTSFVGQQITNYTK